MTDENVLKHFNLLQQEYHKVSNKYQTLKKNYDQLSLTSGSNTIEDNFLNNLNKIVRGLYKARKYSDISIKLQKTTIPGHKIVLEANGGNWSVSDLNECDEIHLENEEQVIGEQLVKWLYLQEFNHNQSSDVLWKVTKVAHEHSLEALKSRCENGLVSQVTKSNCIYFYMKSSELVVEDLRKFCCDLIVSNWNDYKSDDFTCLEASIFLDLLETQSNFPLHEAVKANRDDVVFLYINENYSQLEELVNVINDENEIILDLALTTQRMELCQTLLSHCANVNSVDNYGWSLLHKSILRYDEFSASFLINNGCHLNPVSPDSSQTPLQLIACLDSTEKDTENISKMNKIATLLIKSGADVNHVDNNDMSTLCLAILSGNEVILRGILSCGRCTTINGTSSWQSNKCASKTHSTISRTTLSHINVPPLPLWLAVCREYRPDLLRIYKEFRDHSVMETSPTLLLIENGADPGCLYCSDTGNTILHEIVSQSMEDAAIFILKTYYDKQKLQSPQLPNMLSIENLVNLPNNLKESLLHIAVETELVNLCQLLLQLGADPNHIRRKPLNILFSSSKDELSSSCDSITSSVSLKDEDLNNSNEISKPLHDVSSDSVLSSWSSKTDDLNPFKEFMKNDNESMQLISISLPTIRKSIQNRCLFVDLVHQKKQNLENCKSVRCKTRKTNSEKQVAVDISTPTHLAIKSRNMEIINLFINHETDNGTRVNWLMTDFCGESSFTLTLWNGLISVTDKIFQKLIKEDFKTSEIDQIIVEGQRLFHLAILKNNIEAVQFLIKIGCDINIKSGEGMTPLHLATEKLNIDIIKVLCLSGADPNIIHVDGSVIKNTELSCSLWVALINNRFDIAEILTEAGADVDMWSVDPKDNYEQTLLHRAIMEGNEEIAKFLISHDCDTISPRESKNVAGFNHDHSVKYTDRETPLHMACRMGLSDVVKILLSSENINVNAQNVLGYTAVHVAIRNKQESVLTNLFDPKYKVDLSVRDNDGRTPFRTAMEMSNQNAARSILQYHPQAADETDNLGRNFLHLAVQTMNKEAVFFLIQVNANLNVRVKDPFQYTPLQLSIISSAPEDMIRSLILAGARIDDETIEKQSLLHLAVSYERRYILNFLLEIGASTTHQDNNLETPLHLAIREGDVSIIEPLLIHSSAAIRMKNLKGENILHILSNNVKENAVVIFSLIMQYYPDFPIDEKDACGNTALYVCACNENVKLGISLLMKGSSLGCFNNDGSTLFNCKQISQQTLMKLLDSLDSEPSWSDGDICVSCFCKFSIKNRKHHCRHCGRLLCGKCSVNEIPIIKYNIKKSVRACDACYNFLVNGKLQ